MEPMQSLASSYIPLSVTLVSSQSFLETQAEPEHRLTQSNYCLSFSIVLAVVRHFVEEKSIP